MRIVKLSEQIFPQLEDVTVFFEHTLLNRDPTGKFMITQGRIAAQDGIEPDEILLFSYNGQVHYAAQSASLLYDNDEEYEEDEEEEPYPYYFLVAMDTLQPVEISLHELERRYHQETGQTKSLAKSQGWPKIEDQAFAHNLWSLLMESLPAISWAELIRNVKKEILALNLKDHTRRINALSSLASLISERFPEIRRDPTLLLLPRYNRQYVKTELDKSKPTGRLSDAESNVLKKLYDDLYSSNGANSLQDLKKHEASYSDLPETQREAIIQSRIGQGKFRTDLIKYWGSCAVTGCKTVALLRASHIKPWRKANNEERLDSYNGLLLTLNLDGAFDSGLISFEDDGSIMISDKLDDEDRKILGICPEMKVYKLKKGHLTYLAYHRQHIFKEQY